MSESDEDQSDDFPTEVQAALDQLGTIRGVVKLDCEVLGLEEVKVENLSSFLYATYPIASLRRSNGGRSGEGLIRITVFVSADTDGWRAIEFLSWFFRDQTRGGKIVDFRPFALPPVAGSDVQFGNTLRFFIEMFETDPTYGAPLRRINELAIDLARTISSYDDELKRLGNAGLV